MILEEVRPAAGGDGPKKAPGAPDPTVRALSPQAARAGRMVELTAELAPAAGDPGFPAPWRLAQGLAAGLRPLDTEARLVIAAGTLLSLDREDAEALAEATLADLRRGPPPPVFVADEETPLAAQLAAEARLWGAWASPAELEAYAMACLHRLPPARRRAILAAVGRRAQGAGRGA